MPVALIAALLVAFGDVLFSDRGLVYGAHAGVHRAWLELIRDAAPDLERMWAAAVSSHPGQPSAAFSPLFPILLWPDFDLAYDAFVLAHLGIVLLAAYALGRRWFGERDAAAAAAAVFALSGPVLSLDSDLPTLVSLAGVMSFAVSSAEAARRGSLVLGAAAGGAFAVALAAANFVTLGLAVGFVLIALARPAVLGDGVGRRAALGGIVPGLLLGLGLAAPVLEVTRAAAIEAAAFAAPIGDRHLALGLGRLGELIVPTLFGPPESPRSAINAVLENRDGFLASCPTGVKSLYLGLGLVFGLASLGSALWVWPVVGLRVIAPPTLRPWTRGARLAVGLASLVLVFGVALALGLGDGPGRLRRAPLFGHDVEPASFLLWVSAALAVVVGAGWRRHGPRALVASALVVLFAASIVAQVVFSPEFENISLLGWFDRRQAVRFVGFAPTDVLLVGSEEASALFRAFVDAALARFAEVGVALGAVVVAAIVWAKGRGELAGRLLLVVLLLDLTVAGRATIRGADPGARFDNEDVFLGLEPGRLVHLRPIGLFLGIDPLPGETRQEAAFRSTAARGEVLAPPSRVAVLTPSFRRCPIAEDVGDRVLGLLRGTDSATVFARLRRLGVRYVATPFMALPAEEVELVGRLDVDGSESDLVFRLRRVSGGPRVYCEFVAVHPRTPSFWLARFFEDPGRLHAGLWFDPSLPAPGGDVPLTASSSCAVPAKVVAHPSGELEVESPCPTLVVLPEPRWWATEVLVDGWPRPVVRADLGDAAVILPAGDHRVAARPRSRSVVARGLPYLAAGAALALIALGLRRTSKGGADTA